MENSLYAAVRTGLRMIICGALAFGAVGCADTNDQILATLAGEISETNEVAWHLIFPQGSIPVAPTCSAVGTGISQPTDTAISVSLEFAFAPDCIGVVAEGPSDNDNLSLSRQQ